jgi:hypothetical protein
MLCRKLELVLRTYLAALCFAVPALVIATPAQAQSAPACQYVLGFQTLNSLDPTDTGNCADNQAYAANGDAQQHRTTGLMVWRKADNWTAFTNGYWTWINGPNGLAKRLNTQRFSWEANPDGLPTADAPAPGHSPADQAYFATMQPALSQMANGMGLISTQSTAAGDDLTVLVDPNWRATTIIALASLQTAANTLQSVNNPPADLGDVNRQLQAIGAEVDQIVTNYATGVDDATNGNLSGASTLLNQAVREIQDVSGKATTLTAQLQAMQGS